LNIVENAVLVMHGYFSIEEECRCESTVIFVGGHHSVAISVKSIIDYVVLDIANVIVYIFLTKDCNCEQVIIVGHFLVGRSTIIYFVGKVYLKSKTGFMYMCPVSTPYSSCVPEK
jgi:hypothetical protein